jgi:hypothetical protein
VRLIPLRLGRHRQVRYRTLELRPAVQVIAVNGLLNVITTIRADLASETPIHDSNFVLFTAPTSS